MKLFLKLTAGVMLLFECMCALAFLFWSKPNYEKAKPKNVVAIKKETVASKVSIKLKQKATQISKFAKDNQCNTRHCFMVDMSIASGKERFFVYNLKKDSVEYSGLVTHGAGSITGKKELYFSNVPGSSCTSLGKYKIGNPYQGRFGLAYKLYGLDKTNNKAFERFVVLHGHSCVPSGEVYPSPICPSLGCPTVAPQFLITLAGYIDKSTKPILLYIYQ